MSARRERFPNRQPVTKEEIEALKRRKLQLLEEKKLLKAKVARMEVQNKRGNRPTSVSKQLYNELTKEYKTLEKLIDGQHKKIADLALSDSAALCRELQEETKVILEERLRLEDVLATQEAALRQSERELTDLFKRDGPGALAAQRDEISKLEVKLTKYLRANKVLERKIREANQSRNSMMSGDDEIERRAEQLRKQIRDVKRATEENEKKFQQSQEDHAKMLAKLRSEICESEAN
jgi:chromosome segregation ATPase